MKTRTKALLLALSAIMLVVSTVFTTLAFLKSTSDVATNTFTVGNVQISLDEALVNEYGEAGKMDGETFTKVATVAEADRVLDNTYKLLPGHEYVKDPTVTVKDKSELCYVRMLVTVQWKEDYTPAGDLAEKTALDVLKDAMPNWVVGDVFLLQNLVYGWEDSVWVSTQTVKNDTYEFRYHEIVDAREGAVKLDALFDGIVIPGDIDNDTLATLNNIQIEVVAHAIQADGFNSADEAWAEWD